MVKKLSSLLGAFLLTLALSGLAIGEMIEGTVKSVEREGRQVLVTTNDGKEIQLRISGSNTALEGVGDRSEIKPGMKVKGEYDPGDRNTASTLNVSQ